MTQFEARDPSLFPNFPDLKSEDLAMTPHSQIIYCSRETPNDGEPLKSKITAILAIARRNNQREDITGALLYTSGFFAQVLEGPTDAVNRVFEKISNDPRHRDIVVLAQGALLTRSFPQWTVGFLESVGKETKAASLLARAFARPSEEVGIALRDLLVQSQAELCLAMDALASDRSASYRRKQDLGLLPCLAGSAKAFSRLPQKPRSKGHHRNGDVHTGPVPRPDTPAITAATSRQVCTVSA